MAKKKKKQVSTDNRTSRFFQLFLAILPAIPGYISSLVNRPVIIDIKRDSDESAVLVDDRPDASTRPTVTIPEGSTKALLYPSGSPQDQDLSLKVFKDGVFLTKIDSDMQRAFFFTKDLQKADLRNVNLQQANLVSADLQGALLLKTNLQGAILMDANMQGVDLRLANLEGADLRLANMKGAILPDGTTWMPDTDMDYFTDPNHPSFWRSDDPTSPAYRGGSSQGDE